MDSPYNTFSLFGRNVVERVKIAIADYRSYELPKENRERDGCRGNERNNNENNDR